MRSGVFIIIKSLFKSKWNDSKAKKLAYILCCWVAARWWWNAQGEALDILGSYLCGVLSVKRVGSLFVEYLVCLKGKLQKIAPLVSTEYISRPWILVISLQFFGTLGDKWEWSSFPNFQLFSKLLSSDCSFCPVLYYKIRWLLLLLKIVLLVLILS